MSDDIVDRLRAGTHTVEHPWYIVMGHAADEIERLRDLAYEWCGQDYVPYRDTCEMQKAGMGEQQAEIERLRAIAGLNADGRARQWNLPFDLGDGTSIRRVFHYGGQDPDLYREATDE